MSYQLSIFVWSIYDIGIFNKNKVMRYSDNSICFYIVWFITWIVFDINVFIGVGCDPVQIFFQFLFTILAMIEFAPDILIYSKLYGGICWIVGVFAIPVFYFFKVLFATFPVGAINMLLE